MRASLCAVGFLVGSTVPLASQAVITGTVRDDSTSQVLVGAEIVIERTELRAVTGAGGRYAIPNVPRGEYSVLIRLVGYRPVRVPVRVEKPDTIWVSLSLPPVVHTLEPVTVEGESGTPKEAHLRMFEEHRGLGFGKFFDSTYLRRFDSHRVKDIIQRVPGVRFLTATGLPCPNLLAVQCYVVTTRNLREFGGRMCDMAIYVDGWPSKRTDVWNDWYIRELDGIEVYRTAAEIPAQYNSANSACGVIAVWTRRP